MAKGTCTGTEWEAIADHKKAEREEILARNPGWRLDPSSIADVKDVSRIRFGKLSQEEIRIVSYDATALIEQIQDKHLNCVEVIRAYCHAATIAQDSTNCLTEIFFDEAIERAEELDKYMQVHGKPFGPLHGLPVSIKDHIKVKGKDTSTGYIAWCYKTIADDDAVAVDILRRAGAILYVKTNNPQTLMSLETNNNIFGRTTNPFNRDLTPGGSSGGESALIALHGSPLGIGTDIGGSIVMGGANISVCVKLTDIVLKRLPAATTGLYGLKPSVGRIPHAGLLGSHDGIDAIQGALGPIARSARDLSLFCRVMLQYEPWLIEPPLLEVPWKQDVVEGKGIPSKLSFAILWTDGIRSPDSPITDALKKCKDLLLEAGHEVIDWYQIDQEYSWDLLMKLYFLDGGEEYREVLKESGEPPVQQTEWILGQIMAPSKEFTAREIFKLNLEREHFRVRLAQHWNSTSERTVTGRIIDAIIAPVAPTLAPEHDTTNYWGYTSYWNLADYPAVVFPVRGGSRKCQETRNGTTLFNGNVHKGATDTIQNTSSPDVNGSISNLPICLQLIGRRLNEEKVLGILNVVEDVLKNDRSPSI